MHFHLHFQVVVMEWLDDPSVMRLILFNSAAGLLVPVHNFQPMSKGKICYFIKKYEETITMDNMRDVSIHFGICFRQKPLKKYFQVIIFGDMSSKCIDDLSIMVDQIFYPILKNPMNHEGWPEVVCKDVSSQIQELRNTIAEVSFIKGLEYISVSLTICSQ